MLAPISRVSSARQAVMALSRMAGQRAVRIQMRTFMAPTVSRRADFVQELYLKELKAYKPPPIKDSDATGHVATFKLPKTPKSPEEADLASSLKEYESMAVEVEGIPNPAEAAASRIVANKDDAYLVEEKAR